MARRIDEQVFDRAPRRLRRRGNATGLVAVALFGLASDAGHARDVAMMHGFSALDQSRFNVEIKVVARLPDPLPYAFPGVLFIGVALWRRRPPRALAVAIVLVATGATTHVLKHLLAEPRLADWLGFYGQIEDASWPSGHSTAAMTLALCAVMVSPPAVRAITALVGGAFAIGVGYATLALPLRGRRWLPRGRALGLIGRRRSAARRGRCP